MTSVAQSTDEHLLERTREGDMQAFRQLVERYEGAVAATAIGMLGPGPEAEDVGQETFISLYRSVHKFRGDSSLRTYLTRIAMNRSLTALRKRKTWKQRFVIYSKEEVPQEMPAFEGAEFLDRSERIRLVRKSIDQLGPKHRAVVVLRMIEGYSTAETAKILGVPQGTVASRLSRAMGGLRSYLKPLLNEE